jgi:hypothetical protein
MVSPDFGRRNISATPRLASDDLRKRSVRSMDNCQFMAAQVDFCAGILAGMTEKPMKY